MHTRLSLAIDEIRAARTYSRKLIVETPREQWFKIPAAGVSNVAWQVGHLAMAEYRLALERVRGHRAEDDAVISPAFLVTVGRGSVPREEEEGQPSAEELLAVFDAVHELAMAELPGLTEAVLDEPPVKPHPLFGVKHGSLTWAARHEMIHAGQIGLIRRQLGAVPMW